MSDYDYVYARSSGCKRLEISDISCAKMTFTGQAMISVEVEYGTTAELSAGAIRAQLELLIRDDTFRSSKRSVAFLKYVVEQTLNGQADQIKERSIGIEVFARDPSYDTNVDHIVRTAAAELRKKLATYYVDEIHRSELRIGFIPGSYIPRFTPHSQANHVVTELGNDESLPGLAVGTHGAPVHSGPAQAGPVQPGPVQAGPARLSGIEDAPATAGRRRILWLSMWVLAAVAGAATLGGYSLLRRPTAQDLFWKPVLDTPGPVLVAVGDHPNGPPTIPQDIPKGNLPTPIPSSDASQTVPFADTVTVARVVGVLAARHKDVLIRRSSAISFSDLREGPVVLIGAFNNEWSLRLNRLLRYSLAMDAARHLIYIRDSRNPSSRAWSWGTDLPRNPLTGANSPNVEDYALVSRIRDSETGNAVVVIGGLYTYGTEAAGELLTSPDLMQGIARQAHLTRTPQNLQIVLGTTVTDGIPGPPKVLAVSATN
ncbi:MAG: hypothetical protein ACRD3N_03660 [Terracidiphilus sp.]